MDLMLSEAQLFDVLAAQVCHSYGSPEGQVETGDPVFYFLSQVSLSCVDLTIGGTKRFSRIIFLRSLCVCLPSETTHEKKKIKISMKVFLCVKPNGGEKWDEELWRICSVGSFLVYCF